MILLLVAIVAFFLGHYTRELKETLVVIKARLYELKKAQDKAEPPKTGFAEPYTRAEAVAELEKEKIDMLNR